MKCVLNLKYFVLGLLFVIVIDSYGQEISGMELLVKAINYHDPDNNWDNFNSTLHISLEMPDKPSRFSKVFIDNANNMFKLEEATNDAMVIREVSKGDCIISLNGKKEFTEEEVTKHKLTCDRSLKMRDYYTYLYGLPMKLMDEGTLVHPEVKLKEFMGVDYLQLKVTYDEKVGSDTWYFYFNPKSFAMEIYQFYHDETKNDGEYILLTELLEVDGIKLPKTRKWYVNKDNTLLGADVLLKAD